MSSGQLGEKAILERSVIVEVSDFITNHPLVEFCRQSCCMPGLQWLIRASIKADKTQSDNDCDNDQNDNR